MTLSNLENTQTFQGTVSRVNSRIDQASQTIQVFINIKDPEVKEGMYLEARLEARSVEDAIEIPRELLEDQSKVFVVQEGLLALVDVTPVYYASEIVVIQGLKDGTKLISSPVPGAYPGMEVTIAETSTKSRVN